MASAGSIGQDEVFLRKLRELVLDNLDNESFSVAELAGQAGMSRSQLHRKLKRLKGLSVSRFICEIRLQEAVELLKNDVATTSEIAYRVGFNSPSYFHKCFHEYFGFTPGEVKEYYKSHDHEESLSFITEEANASAKKSIQDPAPAPLRSPTHPVTHPASGRLLFRNNKIIYFLALAGLLVAAFFLYRNGTYTVPREKTVAVLPLNNLSDDPDNQFFADGLVEDLLNRLSKVEDFVVISRTSSDLYRERGSKSIPDIASELGVNYLIEGSIQRSGESARINIQLIDAASDSHLWSKTYDRTVHNIFEIQSEIALDIASEMNALLTEEDTDAILKNRTSNLKAMEYYQLGNLELKKGTGDGYITAINYFEKSLEEDPFYSLAYAGLAHIYQLMAFEGHIERDKGREKAIALANKALELDSSLAEAHTVLGNIYFNLDWNWTDAQNAYTKAIEINPSCSTARHHYASFLSVMNKPEEARKQIDKALALDPLSFVIRHYSAHMFFNDGKFAEALAENRRCKELITDHPWSAWLEFEINYYRRDTEDALANFKEYGLITGEFVPEEVDSIYRKEGFQGLITRKLAYVNRPYFKAKCYAMLEDDDHALQMLEETYRNGNLNPEFSIDYHFRTLSDNNAYRDFLRRSGI